MREDGKCVVKCLVCQHGRPCPRGTSTCVKTCVQRVQTRRKRCGSFIVSLASEIVSLPDHLVITFFAISGFTVALDWGPWFTGVLSLTGWKGERERERQKGREKRRGEKPTRGNEWVGLRDVSRCAARTTLNRSRLTPSRFIPLKSARSFGPKCTPYNHINDGGRDLSINTRAQPVALSTAATVIKQHSPRPRCCGVAATHHHRQISCKHNGVTPPTPRDIAGTVPLRVTILSAISGPVPLGDFDHDDDRSKCVPGCMITGRESLIDHDRIHLVNQ